MFAADVNADGMVDASDVSFWESHAGASGYLPEDLSLDGQVDNTDKNDFWVPNLGAGTQVSD